MLQRELTLLIQPEVVGDDDALSFISLLAAASHKSRSIQVSINPDKLFHPLYTCGHWLTLRIMVILRVSSVYTQLCGRDPSRAYASMALLKLAISLAARPSNSRLDEALDIAPTPRNSSLCDRQKVSSPQAPAAIAFGCKIFARKTSDLTVPGVGQARSTGWSEVCAVGKKCDLLCTVN